MGLYFKFNLYTLHVYLGLGLGRFHSSLKLKMELFWVIHLMFFCEIVNIQRFFGKCHFISKDWLALSQDNVSESSEILPVDCCFLELAVTIQLSALVWYKMDIITIIIKKYLVLIVKIAENLFTLQILGVTQQSFTHSLKNAK